MTNEQLDRGTYLCGVLTDAGQLNPNAAWELADAYHYLRYAYESSQVPPPVEEAQPGSPSPSAPAAAYWPCWAVEEAFDANEADSKWDRYAI